ncbi:DEAD/DEAH box helicase family protein [Helicobacter cetorum]|uniref:DEAD/DEAH box helicase family protein n=1 Tax=Helicobacter cetorum TaxID=138563 RepID=UPI001F1F3F95
MTKEKDKHKNIEIPQHIVENLKKPLREYQTEALQKYLQTREETPNKNHLMFEMATGSGKTLVMASLILDCYAKGYRNFIFFVNSSSIVEKTKLNFTDSASLKYLFTDSITIDEQQVEINPINSLENSKEDAINLYFTTIQALYSLFTTERENALTLAELAHKKIVFLADEAHHLNTETKKKLNKSDENNKIGWESLINQAFKQHEENLLLEFSATIPNDKEVKKKYKDKIVFQYDLKKFSKDKYCKNIFSLLYKNESLEQRFLGAMLSSLFKELLAKQQKIFLKPCILFKSESIKESLENQTLFNEFLENLHENHLTDFFDVSQNELFNNAEIFFTQEKYTPKTIIALLQNKFKEPYQINTNDEKELENNMLLLNSLEETNNPKRVIFSVDKLNEGWDVLNLFDIVRLKNKVGTKQTTTKEAQLIGRGARYYPFSYGNKDTDRRKFNLDNHLSALERLDYHAVYSPDFITNLKDAMDSLGLNLHGDDEKEIIPLKPTKNFKLYYASNSRHKKKEQEGYCYESEQAQKELQKFQVPLFALDITQKSVDFETTSSDSAHFEAHTLKEIPTPFFLKALNSLSMDFKFLKEHFSPNLFNLFNNKLEFIEKVIRPLETNFSTKQRFDNPQINLKMAQYILKNLKAWVNKDKNQKVVTPFEVKSFDPKNRRLYKAKSKVETYEYPWLLYKKMEKLDSEDEKEFLQFIEDKKDKMDKKFKEWCVLRNDHFEELKLFCDDENKPSYAKGFEPDFILFAQTHENEYLGFTYYLEVKGKDRAENQDNAWKDEFLEMLETKDLKENNKVLKLHGLPFFMLEKGNKGKTISNKFTQKFNTLF